MPRCLRQIYRIGLLCAALGLYSNSPALAQQEPGDTPAPQAASPATANRLVTRLRLGDGRHTFRPSRKQLGVSYAPGITNLTPLEQVHFVVDRAKLRRYLNKIAPYIRRSPHDARPIVAKADPDDMGEGQPAAKIIPGYDGAILDTDAAVDFIKKTIETTPGTVHIVLPVKKKAADIHTADLKGINARIGYFVTRFNPGDEGRTQTVRRAIEIIDGHVLQPGAIFSVNEVVGERTADRGFGMGHVFVDGKMEVQRGGGMCQVATTLFNAAMLADLKIVERKQHVRTIPYAEPGRDATVYWGQKDFKFQNDTDAPLYVSYKTSHSRAIVSLFGKAVPGRKVRLVNRHRQLGERHYTGSFYRVISMPDGTKHKDPPFYSDYQWPPSLDYSR